MLTHIHCALEHPCDHLREKCDKITAQLFLTDNIPGLEESILKAFRKMYKSSMIVCRYNSCQLENPTFDAIEARDAHETTHDAMQCPYPGCPFSRAQLCPKEHQKHMREYHPIADDIAAPSSLSRIDTDATLVDSQESGAGKGKGKQDSSDDEEEEVEDDDDDWYRKRNLVSSMLESDHFALRTARWQM
jgi:hypothetical protein